MNKDEKERTSERSERLITRASEREEDASNRGGGGGGGALNNIRRIK